MPLPAKRAPTSCRISVGVPETQKRPRQALMATVVFCFAFMVIEGIVGFLAHSLAVLTDATRMLTDVGALSLALLSMHATSWGASSRYTYGWHRAEVLGALGSVFTIWALVGAIFIEAIRRIVDTFRCAEDLDDTTCQGVDGRLMLIIGFVGLAVNIICALILSWGGHHGHSHGGGGGGGHGHSHGSSGRDEHSHGGEVHGHTHSHGADSHGHHHGEGDGATAVQMKAIGPGRCEQHPDATAPCEHDKAPLSAAAASESSPHGHAHGGGAHGKEEMNVNIRGALLHVLSDCLQSVGVIAAAGFMWHMNVSKFGDRLHAHSYYNLADPMCSIFFGVVTLYTTVTFFRELFAVLMEGTPAGLDYDEIREALEAIEGVSEVHELHVWSLSSSEPALSVHLTSSSPTALEDAERVCAGFNITHTTIQIDATRGFEECTSRTGRNVHY